MQAYANLSDREKRVLHTDSKPNERWFERIIDAHCWDQSASAKRKIRAELRKGLDTSNVRSHFALQNRGNLRLLNGFVDMIRAHAPNSPLAHVPTPILASLPTPYFNAYSAKHPDFQGEAIIFNEALMTFLFLLAKIIARFFPAGYVQGAGFFLIFDRGVTNKLFATDLGSRDLFGRLISGLVYDANPFSKTEPYLLPRGASFVANNLLTYAELFVFAHELAHIALGHHEKSDSSHVEWIDSELLELNTEKSEEFAADAEALNCVLTIVNDNFFKKIPDPLERLTHTYWGIDLFFKALELTSNAITLAKFGYEAQIVDKAHPLAAQRRDALHEIVRTSFPGFNAKLGCPNWEVAVYPGDWIGYLVDAMWNELKPKIKSLHEQNTPVSHRWANLTEAHTARISA
jgi:hypothetical protein